MKDYQFTVSVSYLEIYNEVVNDLLVPNSTNLKVADDPKVKLHSFFTQDGSMESL